MSEFASEIPGVEAAEAPRRRVPQRIVDVLKSGLVRVLLMLIALLWLMPSVGLFVASLRHEPDNNASGWWTVFTAPAQLTLANYRMLLSDNSILTSFVTTVLIAVPATILTVVIAALAGYALAWLDFPGRDWLMVLIVGLLIMPIQVALIPISKLYGLLGVFGSIVGVVLFHVAFGLPFAIFLLRNFFVGIPRDLIEAARMDGAREWLTFRRVVIPVGFPAISSLVVFQFLWVWNDLLVALVFADQSSAPITVVLRSQLREFGTNIDVLSAGSILSMVIPLVVFFSFQRFFVRGVLANSTM
jgi:alpha-glucoside transport system permease protein